MIDMHAHVRPAELIEIFRAHPRPPHIVRNASGVEVLRSSFGEQPMESFDDVAAYVEQMDRLGIETSVVSDPGVFRWSDAQSDAASVDLFRQVNAVYSRITEKYPGRFAAFAALPIGDIALAASELERALRLPGIVGVQLPGNAFLTRQDALAMQPLLEAANRSRAIVFIHHGPRPGDKYPLYGRRDIDNPSPRYQTLDMQASISSIMVTLCLTDILDPYPDLQVYTHNLGGNIAYEVERMDHRSIIFTPDEELPSARFRRSKVIVDCNSFGPHAIEAAIRLYGAQRIVCGTDGTAFGVEWTANALRDAAIDDAARAGILAGNARAMLAHFSDAARRQSAAA